MGLLTEYPIWFILFCLLLGGLYAFLLYFRANREEINPWLLRLMTLFRFLSISLISFLLLSPLIRRDIVTIEKPVIIIGQDNSESLIVGKDSSFNRNEFPGMMQEMIDKLSSEYEIRTYSFGDGITEQLEWGFSEKVTDLSAFFSEISTRYLNRNVGAIVIASDGIYNYGVDPTYTTRDMPYPIYTVALGDTVESRDLVIKQTLFNRKVFLGDNFPVEIQVDAHQCNGERVDVKVKQNGRVLSSSTITIRGNRYSRQIPFTLEALEPGWHKYAIELSPLDREISFVNNKREIFIEVQDVRSKVIVVYEAPHPDIGVLREALMMNRKYEIVERTTEEFLLSSDTAALVIFYQVPSTRGSRISESVIAGLPSALFVLGSQSDLTSFNTLNTGLILSSSRITFSAAYPVLNEAFPYFTMNPASISLFREYPPLQSPFASYQHNPLTEILCYQRINGVTTQFPLICFANTGDQKRGFICGENFWRWRLSTFVQIGEFVPFDELIQKMVQYLSVQADRSFFRINTKPQYLENESVEFEAELYNQSYELINDPEVRLTITDEFGNSYPFVFGPTGKRYYLNTGTFSSGEYQFLASVTSGKENYEKRGGFVIAPVNLEAIRLKADHNLLYRLAEGHRGEMYFPSELGQLAAELQSSDEIHSISYVEKVFSDLISLPWIFLLILSLLSAEWLMRKYSGL